jgi:hypothetical protein
MNKPALRAVNDTPPRTSERAALAAAIERHDAAQRQLAANKSAQEQTIDTRIEARRAVEKSAAMIEEAKVNAATFLANTIMGTAGEAPLTVKAARAAAQDAEDALEAALSAGAALAEQEKSAEREMRRAADNIDERIRDVVRVETGPAVPSLLKDAEMAQSDLIHKRVVLRHLLHNGSVDEAEKQAVKSFLHNTTLPGTYGCVEYTDWERHPVLAPWSRAREALRQDADAALPI